VFTWHIILVDSHWRTFCRARRWNAVFKVTADVRPVSRLREDVAPRAPASLLIISAASGTPSDPVWTLVEAAAASISVRRPRLPIRQQRSFLSTREERERRCRAAVGRLDGTQVKDPDASGISGGETSGGV
jgi:hypothetical protein